MTQDDRVAARAFVDFVSRVENQKEACQFGIRPHSNEAAQSDCLGLFPFTYANGVRPTVTKENIPQIVNPEPATVDRVVDMWKVNRKPVKWILVLDRSGSMLENNHISLLRRAATSFVDKMLDKDYLTVIPFSTRVVGDVAPLAPLGESRSATLKQISGLTAGGYTNLTGAIFEALQLMGAAVEGDRDAPDNLRYNYGILVLTDGNDLSVCFFMMTRSAT